MCSNNDPGMTMTFFYGKVKFGPPYTFVDFSETIVVYDIKVGRCRTAKGQGHSLTLVQITPIQYFFKLLFLNNHLGN